MMRKKQFILCQDDLGNYEIRYDGMVFHFLWEVAPILNEQHFIINKLNDELELISNTKLYSRRELEKKVDEQQSTIQSLKEENEALKKFIKDNFNKMMDSKMVIDDE